MKNHKVQQRSSEWLQLRKGKITGTTLKNIMGTPYARGEEFYQKLAEKLTVGVSDEYENPMDRGNRLEDDAIALFEFETGMKTERVGFSEDDDDPTIANSPDRLIGETKAVEVKCPEGKNYLKIWQENKVPKEYWWQVIQYFVLNKKLETLYFVAHNPDIPMHPLHIIEVHRKDIEADIVKAREAQEKFIAEVNEALSKIIEL